MTRFRFIFLLATLASASVGAEAGGGGRLVFVKAPGQDAEILQAMVAEDRGSALLLSTREGARMAIQKTYVLETVAMPATPLAEWSSEEWKSTLAGLRGAIRLHPEFSGLAADLEAGWLTKRATTTEQALEREWEALRKTAYAPEASRQTAEHQLAALSDLSQRYPAQAEAIRDAMAPWQKHLQHLAAGEQWLEGRWQVPTTAALPIAEEVVKEVVPTPSHTAPLQVQTEIAPKLAVLVAVIVFLLLNALLLLIGIGGMRKLLKSWFGSKLVLSTKQARAQTARSSSSLWVIGIQTLVVFGCLGWEGFYLARLLQSPGTIAAWEEMKGGSGTVELSSIEEFLHLEPGGFGKSELVLTSADASVALASFLDWGAEKTADPLAIRRVGWAIVPRDEAWYCAEEIHFMGRSLLATYRVPTGGESSAVEVRCNGQPLPPWLAAQLWENSLIEAERIRGLLLRERGIRVAVQEDKTILAKRVNGAAAAL